MSGWALYAGHDGAESSNRTKRFWPSKRTKTKRPPKAATESWLVERLTNARVSQSKARARDIMLLMEGSIALTLIHGDRTYIDAAALAA